MAASRDEVLADFQACTGIDDVAECILYLEEVNWNLLDAINRVMPQDTQTLPSEKRMPEVASTDHTPHAIDNIIPQASTSRVDAQQMVLTIEHNGKSIPFTLPTSATIANVKNAIHEQIGIAPCFQDLRGWPNQKISDNSRLHTLGWPNGTILHLNTPDLPTTGDHRSIYKPAVLERMTQTFRLNITDETNKKTYNINFNGSKTVGEVKQDVYAMTNITVPHQQWVGWPEAVTSDSVTIAQSGIGYPCHSLRVKQLPGTRELAKISSKDMTVDLVSESSSGEEFEDASESFPIDDAFLQDIAMKKFQPLMPPNVTDELEAVNHFITEFAARYGDFHPMFFQGTLMDSLREGCCRSAKERKPLAVYLHHDGSVLTNVFCTQLLCSESVVPYLASNFITWPWDLTCEANRARLLTTVTQQFGPVAAASIRSFSLEQLPVLLIITKLRAATEVFTVIHGNVSLEELMTRLVNIVEVFGRHQQVEIVEEEAREAREEVKREQDAAYEASLQADRAKEETKRHEEEERQKIELKRIIEQDRQDEMRKQKEAFKEAIRRSLEVQVPEEPSVESSSLVTRIRVRLPSGQMLVRRFLTDTTLKALLNYLTVCGYPSDEYKALCSWPRRDLTTLDPDMTLEQLRLYPQETITLEERSLDGTLT